MDHPSPDDHDQTGQETKPFLEHLEDLRSTLIGCITALVVGMCVAFPLAPYLLRWLKRPLLRVTDKPDEFLRTLDVTGAFMLSMQIAFWGGLILSAPFLTYFLARFISPGLTARERELVRRSLGLAGGLFFFGVALGYFAALPVAMEVMFGMNKWMGIRAEWTIRDFVWSRCAARSCCWGSASSSSSPLCCWCWAAWALSIPASCAAPVSL